MPLISRHVFVEGLRVEAAIGVYDYEHGRTQPLIIDADIRIGRHEIKGLKDTLNYEMVGNLARDLIARGHIKLVETLAEDLAEAVLALPQAEEVRIRISKPEALADADRSGCIVVISK
ncbi:dihydroneopterin aldolase [Asticcacaulis sp. DW145]|jgi:dihydroneopterin aldolase|uniref:7,8-dihydroneopterin aldolase n=1 Tax=Asticcacaulis currens TaxID=2984210 RepID=A0ABT5ID07_9CAUL|nr:dihydroneopterin aldolase [Asticcacaulis currens]MDC7694068.1 dihydroneopterin aldolase [Asticcacaulis currens]BEV09985.1 dihydroneopterin aldolase [Asticcacaulis sp. DW145]